MDFEFVGLQDLTDQLYKKHPIWVLYEDPEQDEDILAWGVDLEQAWRLKSENPEGEYYFPYLGSEPPGLVRGTTIYCNVQTAGGAQLTGTLVGGFAFSVFVSGEEYLFNTNMPDYGMKASKELCFALKEREETVFPLLFTPVAQCFSGRVVTHGKYW
ncbi:hypothetical protein [Marinobacter sp. NFXS9]|uniref:hypothetical protein n=1 Tax=Marinobacter sp. NFXS9 TaxID=2818433 RepID=UPI0032DE3936